MKIAKNNFLKLSFGSEVEYSMVYRVEEFTEENEKMSK
jgi:hypothetical protein